jgi:hypothetical protein
MKRTLTVLAALVLVCSAAYAQDASVIYSFEEGLEGWDVPDWAYEKPDHVQKSIAQSDSYASDGSSSLAIDVDFPGGSWTGAIVEIMQYFDWTDYSKIECDIYLPADAPKGLKASMILTVGDSWKWVEQSKSVALKPGEWVTISGDLKPGSIDWRRTEVDDAFRSDIRKIDVRIESNNKPAYTGMVYVDNVKVVK